MRAGGRCKKLESSHSQLVAQLKKLHRRRYCVLVGSGTTALVVALAALDAKGKRVGFQDTVCPNLLIATHLIGAHPVFLPSVPGRLSGVSLESSPNVDVIIGIHAYGFPCNVGEMSAFCRQTNTRLIEDVCVGQGGTIGGRPLGSFGDISVLSFGSDKTVEVGHGGAILTDSVQVYQRLKSFDVGKPPDATKLAIVREFGRRHTELYNRHYLEPNIEILKMEFHRLLDEYSSAFIFGFDSRFIKSILSKMNRLSETREARAQAHRTLEKTFRDQGFDYYGCPPEAVPWRFSVRVKNRNYVVKRLLSEGEKISSWYPSLGLFFDDGDCRVDIDQVLKKDDILNLWINGTTDSGYRERVSRKIFEYADA